MLGYRWFESWRRDSVCIIPELSHRVVPKLGNKGLSFEIGEYINLQSKGARV